VARIPDRAEYQRRWRALDTDTRRSIVRSVNRGLALDDPREAAMAVMTARQQQRFWAKAWMIAPVASLLVLISPSQRSLVAYAANSALGILILGVMGMFSRRRAHRAEVANTERAAGKRRKGATGNGGKGSTGSHTPRRRGKG
jgi:hypothetical protein